MRTGRVRPAMAGPTGDSPWTDDRIWDAVDAWRWAPPSAKRVVTPAFELAVTPGSTDLTFLFGFHTGPGPEAEKALDAVQQQVLSLGGTGVRFQVTPRSRPEDLRERLLQRGYRLVEETEALSWNLRSPDGAPRLPEFPAPTGIVIREVRTDEDYDSVQRVSQETFGEPPPPAEAAKALREDFHRLLRETGHSNQYLAMAGSEPVGVAGLSLVNGVARFWGSGVREAYRRRGIYGALVRTRCEDAAQRGGEIALVIARVGTSGPVLKHRGFRPLGSVQLMLAEWGPGSPSAPR